MIWVELVGVIAGVLLLVSGVIVGVQKASPHHVRAQHNDVAGFVYAVLGVLYAVLLAFVVVDEWEALGQADRNTFAETDKLGSLYWNARAMPPDIGRDLEATTKLYAETVIHNEWPLLNRRGYSREATGLVYRMRDQVNALPTDTARERTLFDESLRDVNDLAAARRMRLSESGDQVPAIMWAALVLGATLTVGYTFLFGLSKFWSHLLIAGPLATLVILALILIEMLDHPFANAIGVHPEAFEIFLRDLPAQRV